MRLYKAEISDILRCIQRDEAFVNELQDYIADILKLVCGSRYHTIRQYIPLCANTWYYLLTSVTNLQTLGEEYTGTIRISSNNEIPSKIAQVIWLTLFIGGDKLFDKFLMVFGKKIHYSNTLTEEAKTTLLKTVDFFKENKHILLRLHQSIFYIYGIYHNLSNRLAGIKYVLLREWMQDSGATKSFNILGKLSLLYLLYVLLESVLSKRKAVQSTQIISSNGPQNVSNKTCVLCMEDCKNVCCTPCGHLFCWDCIFDSIKYQPNCPVCREDVLPSRIILLQNY